MTDTEKQFALVNVAISIAALLLAFHNRPRSHRGRRGGLGGLAGDESSHAHEAGRALLLAEKAAGDAQDAILTDDCEGSYSAVVRARTALATAHAHAASLDRPAQAIQEASVTGRAVLAADRAFRRSCLVERMRLQRIA